MRVHAAMIEGPHGPFAVLRAYPEPGEPPVTDEQRREIARCFRARHENVPVTFLGNDPDGLRLWGDDVTAELADCVHQAVTPDVTWDDVEWGTGTA